jgi:cephalosporin-C deacetylase-like acetyl esterase
MYKPFLFALLSVPLAGFGLYCAAEGATAAPAVADDPGLTGFDHWLNGIAAKDLTARREKLASIHSRADAVSRQMQVRSQILALIGGLPARTPLNARSTGETPADGFVIRKVLFDSQPGFPVTALLYVPTGTAKQGDRPAILISPGHYPAGKVGDARMAALFARNGFVVLSYDPIGLGERLQYGDPANPKISLAGPPTSEHAEASLQPILIGDTFSRYVLWDAIRGIDYLSSLPGVDSKRIGAFGCSGGGTITAMLGAIDKRVAAVGVACYITTFDALLPTLGPQDAEQTIPRFISSGLDFADWIESAAPRPYAVISTYSDMFPFEGARASVAEARRFYAQFDPASAGTRSGSAGAGIPAVPSGPALNADTTNEVSPSAKLQFITGPGKHGALWPIAPAILSFFIRNLEPDVDADHPNLPAELVEGNSGIESTLHALPSGALQVTETGQVATSIPDVKTVAVLNRERSKALPGPRGAVPVTELRRAIRTVTGARALPKASHSEVSITNAAAGKLTLPLEGATSVQGELSLPGGSGKRPALLILLPDKLQTAGVAERAYESQRDALIAKGNIVLAIPPIPTLSDTDSSKHSTLGPLYLPSLRAELVGRTLVGVRIDEVVRAVDYLVGRSDVDRNQISAIASGHMGIVLLHAAVIDPRIGSVFVEHTLESYRSLLDEAMPAGITEDILPGVLTHYDIPNLKRALGSRVSESGP